MIRIGGIGSGATILRVYHNGTEAPIGWRLSRPWSQSEGIVPLAADWRRNCGSYMTIGNGDQFYTIARTHETVGKTAFQRADERNRRTIRRETDLVVETFYTR